MQADSQPLQRRKQGETDHELTNVKFDINFTQSYTHTVPSGKRRTLWVDPNSSVHALPTACEYVYDEYSHTTFYMCRGQTD